MCAERILAPWTIVPRYAPCPNGADISMAMKSGRPSCEVLRETYLHVAADACDQLYHMLSGTLHAHVVAVHGFFKKPCSGG